MKKKINNETYLTLDENAQYFECGYSCDNAVVLNIQGDKFFITDSRYTLEAQQNTKNTQVIQADDLLACACGIFNKNSIQNILFDPNQMTFAHYEKLKSLLKSSINLMGVANFHQFKRIIKTDEEIKWIKKSQKLNEQAYEHFSKYLYGYGHLMSEEIMFYHAKNFLSYQGKYELSFYPILGINGNAAKPHALPSPKDRLKYGDLLLFDAGIKYKRYCSDRTRTAYFTKEGIDFKKHQKFKDKKLQKIYDTVLSAQEKTIELLRSGMSGKEIDGIARGVIEESGYGEYFIHSTGHGIGLDIHELPFISKRSEVIVEDGMVFSIEPGIYIPGHYGVRIEDLVVVKNGKAQIL
ncbi:M24 family metallopeptidase [Helicobacter sp. 11S03491-1]|uniref:M24 family metallopeptidase n=1 Tax=Helicobacter sp. 11S03491-1 TaxID=1476196 RepID=UPI000BA54C77|nr:M24 family metallopeptidase [Helicobacter sp. 11S03491-1]PAF42632.1 X-Pro aminopeptidase [Helicobacter sp. 11S03491-1]